MNLANNIWWTRKSRIQTEKRLLSNAFQSELLLFWYSLCSVFVSIYYLKFNIQNDYTNIVWVSFSVLLLGISSFINGFSFKERASLVKECYESLNTLYQKLIQEPNSSDKIAKEYKQILTICENHIDQDYHMALCDVYFNNISSSNLSDSVDRKPNKYIWLCFGFYHFRKFTILGFLYLLPMLLFYIIQ